MAQIAPILSPVGSSNSAGQQQQHQIHRLHNHFHVANDFQSYPASYSTAGSASPVVPRHSGSTNHEMNISNPFSAGSAVKSAGKESKVLWLEEAFL